jgi:hypothetical protein
MLGRADARLRGISLKIDQWSTPVLEADESHNSFVCVPMDSQMLYAINGILVRQMPYI